MSYITGIIFSTIAGIVLGLESETRIPKETKEKSKLGGIRTYTILALLGAIGGIFFDQGLPTFSILIFLAVVGMVVVAYIYHVKLNEAFGLTTEVAVLMTYLLGFFATSAILPLQINIVLLVVLLLFLSSKEIIVKLIKNIEHSEVVDFVQFALVALVILPFLPSQDIYLVDLLTLLQLDALPISESVKNFLIFNPYSIWFTIVLISGFDLFGYITTKFFGQNKGLYLAGFFSGIVSSTSATIAFAKRSQAEKSSGKLFAGSIMLANGASFTLLLSMMFVANIDFAIQAFPILLALFLVSMIYGTFLFFQKTPLAASKLKPKHVPYSIVPAVKFVFLILVVSFIVQILQLLNTSNELIIIITSISGLVGVNAPVVATATLYGSGIFTMQSALLAFLLINIVNFFGKAIYSVSFGTRELGYKIIIGMILTGLAGSIVFALTVGR